VVTAQVGRWVNLTSAGMLVAGRHRRVKQSTSFHWARWWSRGWLGRWNLQI